MTDHSLIINLPHLQSLRQRLGSWLVSLACWLLWLYFLAPLITLGGWVLGVKGLAKEIRWFGGTKSLQELLWLYGETVLVLALCWLLWALYQHLRFRSAIDRRATPVAVSESEMCAAYHVAADELRVARDSRMVTVHFDGHGHIVHLTPGTDPAESPAIGSLPQISKLPLPLGEGRVRVLERTGEGESNKVAATDFDRPDPNLPPPGEGSGHPGGALSSAPLNPDASCACPPSPASR